MNNKYTVAIVGRPNVGKSTLFNLLSKKNRAIVHDKPGVTRDRKYSDASLYDLDFQIIDTPGLEQITKKAHLSAGMRDQAVKAVVEADAVMFVVDAFDGIMPDDYDFAKLVRRLNNKIIFVANKAEKKTYATPEYYKLGLGEPVNVSAAHRLGMMELYESLEKFVPEDSGDKDKEDNSSNLISIAIVGKPNVGKSSFVNAILGEERLLTYDEAGTTRESIDVFWEYEGQKFKLIDTAGIRRKRNIEEELEQLSAGDAIHSIKFATTVILMLDATQEISKQDLVIANLIIEHGRCLVIVFNKIDLVKDIKDFKAEVNYQLEKSLGQVSNVSVVYTSAKLGRNITDVIDNVMQSYEIWNKKVSTSKLNQWLVYATSKHTLTDNGIKIRIKYGVQKSTRPPSFQFFSNRPDKITDSYKQYLLKSLRQAFELDGMPIRMKFVATKNPYNKTTD